MAGKTIVWNGNSSDSLNGVIIGQINRGMIGRPRTKLMEVAGKEGFYSFPQPRGSRIITAEVSISTAAGQDHDDAVEAFADWLDVETEAQLKIGNADRHYLGVLRDAPEPNEWRGLSQFQVVWECQPFAYGDAITVESWSGASGVNNVWNPDVGIPVKPLLSITPTNGTLTGFTISGNGYVLGVSDISVASGETIVVNCIVPAVLYGPNDDVNLVGAYDPGDLAMAGVDGDFPWLIPGASNQIQFTKDSGTATTFDLSASYRKTYRR